MRWPAITRMEALWTAIRCLPEEDAMAALESAIHLGFLSEDQVRFLYASAPRRLNDGVCRIIATSESGNETIVRMRLERAGFAVVSQGRVPGIGRNDLVVEDCVDIDVDGRRWHGEDRFAIDRDRDIHVEGLGRRVIRLRASHIHASWPHTLEVITRVVADARRERDRRFGRVIVRESDPF